MPTRMRRVASSIMKRPTHSRSAQYDKPAIAIQTRKGSSRILRGLNELSDELVAVRGLAVFVLR